MQGCVAGALHLIESGGLGEHLPPIKDRVLHPAGETSTIDNDLGGTDATIGVDTALALNIAIEAIDRLKTTASSHERLFLVEVMGRKWGYLALMAGLAGGAEVVVIPEVETSPEDVERALQLSHASGKRFGLVVVAEGACHNAQALSAHFRDARERLGFDLRVTTLGHVQRGGVPTAQDRVLATRLGAGAVAALADGATGVLVGTRDGRVARTPLREALAMAKPLPADLLALTPVLAR